MTAPCTPHSYMPSRPENRSWDFSQVIDLVNTLSFKPKPETDTQPPQNNTELPSADTHKHRPPDETKQPSGLGDFSRVWEFLKVPSDIPPPVVPTSPVTFEEIKDREEYASDGALYKSKATNDVSSGDKGADGGSGEMQLDTAKDTASEQADGGAEEADSEHPHPATKPLSKKQRKKRSRKLRQEARNQAIEKIKAVSDFEPEAEFTVARKSQTPASKASVHSLKEALFTPKKKKFNAKAQPPRHLQLPTENEPKAAGANGVFAGEGTASRNGDSLHQRYNLRSRNAANEPPTPKVSELKGRNIVPKTPEAQKVVKAAKEQDPSKPPATSVRAKIRPAESLPVQAQSVPAKSAIAPKDMHLFAKSHASYVELLQAYNPQAQISTPSNPVLIQQTGSSAITAGPHVQHLFQTPDARLAARPALVPASVYVSQPHFASSTVPLHLPARPQTFTVRHDADRHFHFLMKLIQNFGEDRKWLVAPAQAANHNTAPHGIHVFVDASNIFIGFQNYLKMLQGIHPKARAPWQNISFDSLVQLMERRRPVAKRVLVGSHPYLPPFEMAKTIGYETSILDKVYKARELNPRQIRRAYEKRNGNNKLPGSGSGGYSSESETSTGAELATPQYARQKWVEQGVDEILHLKILESVVDVDVPSTMVLATGDAAEAEYSQGFLRMVERALKKGWKVELLAWSTSISMDYRKPSWVKKWGDRFRIIELDEYAEDLLDT